MTTFEADHLLIDPADEPTTDALDELAVDEAKHYKAKISKWIKCAVVAACDVRFWYLMHIAHSTRGPLLHFYRWLCSKQRLGRMMIVELVSWRAEAFHSEFAGRLSDFTSWTNDAIKFAQGVANITRSCDSHTPDTKMLRDIAATLLLQNAACFSRRVLQVYRRHHSGLAGHV